MWDEYYARENVVPALTRVGQNEGSPGADGTTVDALLACLKANRRWIRRQLLEGIQSIGGKWVLHDLFLGYARDRFVSSLVNKSAPFPKLRHETFLPPDGLSYAIAT